MMDCCYCYFCFYTDSVISFYLKGDKLLVIRHIKCILPVEKDICEFDE